jgi:phosphatidate cytidylyltransferase
MLTTRLWMGAILAVLAICVLVLDPVWFPNRYPFLLIFLLFLSLAGCRELLFLIPAARRPPAWLCYPAVFALILSNWPAHLMNDDAWRGNAWLWVAGTFAVIVLSAFVAEMATFREPGESVTRIALTIWIAAYVGLLPSFFAQLRWLDGPPNDFPNSTLALALAIFVPKGCDIGAYFVGRLIGRHPMTPILSPKKTWEGFAGGLAAAVGVAAGIGQLGPVLHGSIFMAIAFGVTVGVAGVLGDLAESLIKRDFKKKDAAQSIPGFGGVLDVVDAVVFAAPVVYWWLVWP